MTICLQCGKPVTDASFQQTQRQLMQATGDAFHRLCSNKLSRFCSNKLDVTHVVELKI